MSASNVTRTTRGSVWVWIALGVAAASATVLALVDFDALAAKRDEDALRARFAAYADARRAEDVDAIAAFVAPGAREKFDGALMAQLWSFDVIDVDAISPSRFDIDQKAARAVVKTVADISGSGLTQSVPFDVEFARVGGEWYLVPGAEPWGRSIGDVRFAERREELETAFARWTDARKRDDLPAQYSMLAPEDRRKVSLGVYEMQFGTGVMKVHDMKIAKAELADDGLSAIVHAWADVELVPANMPADMRRGLRIDDPSALRVQNTTPMAWDWVDGAWYCRLEQAPPGATAITKEESSSQDQTFGPSQDAPTPDEPK
ncbi:MAG: hypothetical protein R3F34_09450 [Planctomycetota bacterium]